MSGTTAVVLGATRRQLRALEKRLLAHGVPHVAIREPDPPWNGALMAIGLVPAPRADVAEHLAKFTLL